MGAVTGRATAGSAGQPLPRRRFGLLAMAAISLLAGLTGALVLLGISMPADATRLAGMHGVLMPLGFLGTLIALERAVALGRPWGYLAPLATGLGAVALIVGLPPAVGLVLIGVGGTVYAEMYAEFARLDRTLHTAVQALGALAWVGAALLLVAGRPTGGVVVWLAAFLVLTIVGERLELSRLRRPSPTARRLFLAAGSVFVAGVVTTIALPDIGTRVAGVGLVALAAWLARNDIAIRTVRIPGVTRFVAISLLAGYVWLAVAGVTWVAVGAVSAGPGYDAMLHALFLGFVISMVYGHAPVILPSVLRTPLPYRPVFYLHAGILHAGLALRIVVGDLLGSFVAWQVGGVLGVVSMLVFVGVSAAVAVHARVQERRADAARARAARVPEAAARP